jgi:hypothetical protein
MIAGTVWSVEYRELGGNKSAHTDWCKTKAEASQEYKELLANGDIKEVQLIKHSITYYDWVQNDRQG